MAEGVILERQERNIGSALACAPSPCSQLLACTFCVKLEPPFFQFITIFFYPLVMHLSKDTCFVFLRTDLYILKS